MEMSNLRYVGGYQGDLLVSVRFVTGFDLTNVAGTNLVEKSSREVVIQTTSSQLLLTTYVISNIIYPSINQPYPIDIIISTSSNHAISKSSNLQWTITCSLPCKQCLSNNPSSCNSCYSDGSLVDGYILWHSLDKKCLKECGDTYYPNLVDSRCYKCSENCLTCIEFDKCRTCKPNWFLVKALSTCSQSQCPSGYYLTNQ